MIGINQLVAVVTLIVLMRSGNVAGTATGFFYANKDSLYLITNKHVITKYAPDALKLRLHKSPNNIMDNGEFLVKLYDKKKKVWLEHKKKEVDVVAVPLDKIKLQKDFFIKALSKDNFLPEKYVMSIGEDAMVIGYPRGFHDKVFNLPIYRNAMVASTYPVPFEGHDLFLIDAYLHNGTSGSPVFTKPKNMWLDNEGNTNVLTGNPTYFLGVHSASLSVLLSDQKEEALGLNVVWYAQLIEEIIL